MAIALLRMGQDLIAATGMVALMDMVAGAVVGMQVGVLGGDILLFQLAIHTHIAHHLQCMCSRFWLNPLFWPHKRNPQSGIFVPLPRSISHM
jgi:hypothetical protein